MKNRIFTLLFIILSMNILKAQVKRNDKIVIYQIFTRLFSNQNITNKTYGTLIENGTGKFNDINKNAIKSLKELGISHIWFTGVIEHALMTDYTKFKISKDHPQVVKGIAGSPYAIKDYYDVNPDLAESVENRMQEFENLIERTHKEGLKVIIDFVPNHVARQYKSDNKPKGIKDFGSDDNKKINFDNQNNFYYIPNKELLIPEEVNPPINLEEKYVEIPAKATGNDVFKENPSINDWYETVKLNYGIDYLNNRTKHFDPIPNTWIKMKDILIFWTKKGVNGFRCDMAEMVPVEFWGWVIPQIKEINEEVIFIAEIYNPNEYRNYILIGKFDYLYDKVGLYDALRRLIEGNGNTMDITKVWQKESGDFSERMLRFLENHDEQRIASDQFGKNPSSAFAAMMLSSTLHSGPILLYFGQELGVKPVLSEGFSGNDGRTTIFDYWGVTEMQNFINNGKFNDDKITKDQKSIRDFYKNTLRFATSNKAIREGKFWDLQYLNAYGNSENYIESKVYSYIRYSNDQFLVFIFNFDLNKEIETSVKLPKDLIFDFFGNNVENTLKIERKFEGSENSKLKISELIEQKDTKKGIPVKLFPNSFIVYEIKN